MLKGGDKLRAYLAGIAKRVESGAAVRAGFLEGSTDTNGMSMPLKAALNEFGAPARGIPPRPFMRQTFQQQAPVWGKKLAAVLKANGYDAHAALDTVGMTMAEDIQGTIVSFTDPPNAPSTIARKGFDAPLRDTRDMLHAVKHEVVDGTE